MKREEKDDVPERDGRTQAAIGLESDSMDTNDDAAPQWQTFYAAVRDAIEAMRRDSES